jgi:hypothetical protein
MTTVMHYYSNCAMDTLNYVRLDCGSQQALAYKHQLDLDGLIVNQDYEWRYQKPVYDEFAWSDSEVSHVTFTFQNPSLATFYQLKWLR